MRLWDENIEKWDLRFLSLAKHVAQWSKDPSTKVGAVLVDPNTKKILSLGYNGYPIGVPDDHTLNVRDEKLKKTVHAELNCLLFAGQSVKGSTLYVWPFIPCSICAGAVIQSGIKRVVSIENNNERWKDSFITSKKMFAEVGIEVTETLNTSVLHAETENEKTLQT